MILGYGDISGLSRWAQCNHKGPEKWKRAAEEKVRVREGYVRKIRPAFTGFEGGGRGP